MRNQLGHYVSAAFLPWFLLGGATGCTGESETATGRRDTRASEVDAGTEPPLTGLRPVAQEPVQPVEAFDAAGSAPTDIDATGAAADGGALDARPDAAPRCVPEGGVDEPDDAFADTNCDGIDGDASRALFVAPTGSDDGSGTPDAPFKTINKAVVNAAANGKSVYVCNGEYAENVGIHSVAVSIYGGYDCSDGWKRVTDRATVKPAAGMPLDIFDVWGPVVIERLTLRAPNAVLTEFGSSSVAAGVTRSDDVVFRRSLLVAGDAAPGWEGQRPRAPSEAMVAAAPGKSGLIPAECVGRPVSDPACSSVSKGGRGEVSLCWSGQQRLGGPGGNGINVRLDLPVSAGAGGIPFLGSVEPGRDGATGAVGESGAPGTLGFGRLFAGVYMADNNGGVATEGNVGEAGVGGLGGYAMGDLASYWLGGGGGQGGYPGCGGPAGNPGGGGGASIALMSDDSKVRVENCQLETGKGGDGGNGTEGLPGQQGGSGAPGGVGTNDITHGLPGGKGGDGGHGGAGGPGGGGPSVGIAWRKTAPDFDDVTFVIGIPGKGGTTSARIAATGVVGETYPPVKSGKAGLGGAQ